ncbi:hypothetical protein [Gemmata sp. SH-PL17]|uniref:hypothetical protein n=1 Tax=Gemmata sp. SH-PL17 TaxID=1630693 RepID=UPI0012F9AD0B|nr:hypothetical protein [Gemmata sp. SH-PL17]
MSGRELSGPGRDRDHSGGLPDRGQPLRRPDRIDILEAIEIAPIEHATNAADRELDVRLGIALRSEVRGEVLKVVGERALAVRGERVRQPHARKRRVGLPFPQRAFGRLFVAAQRNVPARYRAVPFGGFSSNFLGPGRIRSHFFAIEFPHSRLFLERLRCHRN